MNPRKHPEAISASHPTKISLILLAVVMTLTTACQSSRTPQASSDHGLLLIDGMDPIPASSDILAVYAQTFGQHTNLRIDFLDFSEDHIPALRLYFDTFPGQASERDENDLTHRGWDTSLEIIPGKPIVVRGDFSTQRAVIHVDYDAILDTVRVSIPSEMLRPPSPFVLAVSSFDTAQPSVGDSTYPVRSDIRAPNPIPILIVFKNVFPSTTPAQASRSWDGAHSGPAGERFGLKYLLEAVESFKVPMVLTDLRHPDSMAGLRLLGADRWVKNLEETSLLTIPDYLPGAICDQAIEHEWPNSVIEAVRSVPTLYGYQSVEAISCPENIQSMVGSPIPPTYRVFLGTGEVMWIGFHESQVMTSNLPAGTDPTGLFSRAYDGGAPLALREALASGLDIAEHPLLVLQADFQTTFMGDDQDAAAVLGWIAAHPWIKPIPLASTQLLRLGTTAFPKLSQDPDKAEAEPSLVSALGIVDLLPLIDAEVSSGLASFAWQLLIASNTEPSCGAVQNPILHNAEAEIECSTRFAAYRHGLDILAAVQEWEVWRRDNTSVPGTSTRSIIMHPNFLVALNEDATKISAVFARHDTLGSIPIIWDPVQQIEASDGYWQVEIDPGHVDGLRFTYQSGDKGGSVVLPIYLGYLIAGSPETCRPVMLEPDQIDLGCQGGTTHRIELEDTAWYLQSILDTPAHWDIPEDPNQEVPEGHFLRIPYAELTLTYDGPFSFEMTLPAEQ